MTALSDLADQLVAARSITAADVLALRREIFGAVEVTLEEAETLVRLSETVADAGPEWRMLFVEALSDIVVRQQSPSGYVDETQADWLMARLERDGRTSEDEVEALIKIMETADHAPPRLAAFALAKVKAAVSADGSVGSGDVDRVRRILYAFAGPGVIAVTREEAEALFDINEAVRGGDNDPAWTDLFARAVGSAVLTAPTYAAPGRAEADHWETWLHSRGEIRRGWTRVFGRRGLLEAAGALGPSAHDRLWAERQARVDAALAAAAPVTAEEAGWLIDRLNRDGALNENEMALLRFVRAEAPHLDEAIRPLMARAA
jgi:hypothetical protein